MEILPQPLSPALTVIVRTVNVQQVAPNFQQRLLGIAKAFHTDAPAQIGLIGIQEAGLPPVSNTNPMSATQYLASELTQLYGSHPASSGRQTGSTKRDTNVGNVVGGEWDVVGQKDWKLSGIDGCVGTRQMIEVVLAHRSTGYHLRFYSVHLSAGNDGPSLLNPCEPSSATRRRNQVKDLIKKVRERAQAGEVPAIVVGDFNAGHTYCPVEAAEASVTRMEADFWRPVVGFPSENSSATAVAQLRALLAEKQGISSLDSKCDTHDSQGREDCHDRMRKQLDKFTQDHGAVLASLCQAFGPDTGIDLVYVAKKASVPKSSGAFVVLEHHRVPLNTFSDHAYSEGFMLGISEPVVTLPQGRPHRQK